MFSKTHLLLAKLRRPISLRSHLIILSVALAIPLLVFAVWMIVLFDRQQRETFQKGATQRTLALSTAVDAELKGSVTSLEALATSRHLDVDNLRAFYEEAARVLKSQAGWFTINLASPTGRQVVNLQRPFGVDLPMIVERASFSQLLRTGKPTVGHLSQGPVENRYSYTVRVPVVRNGVIKYVLTAIVDPQTISALLAAQKLPSDWVGVVLDGNRRFVTRTVNPELSLGQLASESLRAALDRRPEGWFEGTTIENWNVYTAYNRSAFSGWTVSIAIPAAAVEATFRRSILYLAGLGFFMLAIAIALASITSRKTVTSIDALLTMAEDLGLGKRPAAAPTVANSVPSTITEIESLREAFSTANRLIQQRIEERDRVEATLREVTERLELAQEAANIGTFERNMQTNEVTWSTSEEKLYGLVPGSFEGKYENWRERVHPEDIAAVEVAMRRSAETRIPLDIEFRIVRPDASVRWIAAQAKVFADEQGAPLRMVGINIDITERKEADKTRSEQARLLDLSHEAIIMRDANDRIIYWNHGAEELYGWSGEEVRGKVTHELFETEFPEPLQTIIAKLRRDNHWSGNLIHRRRDGKRVPVSSSWTLDRETEDRPACIFEINTDITERKQAEKELAEAYRHKDAFIVTLGHELRNPLGVVRTAVQLLRRNGSPDPELQELRDTIERQVAHMGRLLDDLLDLSRISRGQIRVEKEPCDLSAIARQAAEDYRATFKENGLDLLLAIPNGSFWIAGDRTRLAQIVGNLLHNTVKFTDRGGKVIVELSEAPGGTVVLTVRDTGIGMEPEMLAHAFEPFVQANTSIERSRNGLGLGLALVKGLVELHGGKLSAASDGPGLGSEFTIRLPLDHEPPQMPKFIEPANGSACSRRVLIIEDSLVASKSMQLFLAQNGHSVEMAPSGPAGLEVARRFQPEVVLCDIGLPGMDGYAVCQALRRALGFEGAYVIAISGYGQEEDVRRAREAGFDIHMTKPVNLDELERLLCTWIAPGQQVAV